MTATTDIGPTMTCDCPALAIPDRPSRIMPLLPFSEGMMLMAILLVTVLAKAV